MDIVHITSELAPIIKVGGLADALYGLCNALAKKGNKIQIFLPKYKNLDTSKLKDLHPIEENFKVEENHIPISNTLWSGRLTDRIECLLIEDHKNYFNRDDVYGYPDDNDRFLYFCKVASTYLERKPPAVVHLHDWPTALCTLILKDKVKTVFTIHNLSYQGICAPFNLERLKLSYDPQILNDPHELDALNLLKGAIHSAEVLTTVSPSYAQEILTSDEGCGLDEDLNREKKKLKGILNGIDCEYWDPERDPGLAKNYSFASAADGKKRNKEKILKDFNLEMALDKPLVIAITRLVPQKGPDLIAYGIEQALALGGQFVLLGSCGDPETREHFEALAANPHVALSFTYNEPLAHLLYAGGDMLLMPSIFEPCGLTQMIAMRYGTVPLVRATGGLKDTVIEGENGFLFDIPDNKGVLSVLEKGFKAYKSDAWKGLIEKGMQADWSWEKSADQYLGSYTRGEKYL